MTTPPDEPVAREILTIDLSREMRQSYLDYAMSVIVGRALPDARDGLKPVHRRVLYAMRELGNDWNKAYKKSARVVGDVIGKYHPHGDAAVYDTIVRMAQPFSLRYLLVDGQGNFGSVDGDAPAAMRYTEVRMSRLAHELLADIDEETVDFGPNYDGSEREPLVLPTTVPNLLVNGAAGIAVGMATNIPPHNLGEVVDACLALLDQPGLEDEALLSFVPGPDFPTAALLYGSEGLREAYLTGRGRVTLRARTETEELKSGRVAIVVRELPYQVNKARVVERIAELVKERRLEGIAELRDESDKDGIRVVLELKRDAQSEVVLNHLFRNTPLETVFAINMVALVAGQPRTLGLRALIEEFLRHRREVVVRRTLFRLRKAKARGHTLEGLAVALANLDEMIALIRAAESPAAARTAMLAREWQPGLVASLLAAADAEQARPDDLGPEFGLLQGGYRLSEAQAQAILDLRLHRLTGLEQEKIVAEYREVLEEIGRLLAILQDPERLTAVIREELERVRAQFADPRRTEIIQDLARMDAADLAPRQDLVVTLSREHYLKSQPLSQYAAQRRGGRGRSATRMKENDEIVRLLVTHSHDWLLFFTSSGRVHWRHGYDLPLSERTQRGRPIHNLLQLAEDERINAILPVDDFSGDAFLLFATREGVVKKTALSEFSRPHPNGIYAMDLRLGDELVGVAAVRPADQVLLFTRQGRALRFDESTLRPLGRKTQGVRGIRLLDGDHVVALISAQGEDTVLTATTLGFGKRMAVADFPLRGRGGQGVLAMQSGWGELVGAERVETGDELLLMTDLGTLVRIEVDEVKALSRITKGVKLIRLGEEEQLRELARIPQAVLPDEAALEEAGSADAADEDDLAEGRGAGHSDPTPGAGE